MPDLGDTRRNTLRASGKDFPAGISITEVIRDLDVTDLTAVLDSSLVFTPFPNPSASPIKSNSKICC